MLTSYQELVRSIYGDCFNRNCRILTAVPDFISGKVPITKTIEAIRDLTSYNNFEGKAVAIALENLLKENQIKSISFGRESSPVLYLNLQVNADKYYVMEALRELRPDELDEVEKHFQTITIRAWWD